MATLELNGLVFTEVETEKELSDTKNHTFDYLKPGWMKEGFDRYPPLEAIEKFRLGDADTDCFVYHRKKDSKDEFIYFVDGWYPNSLGVPAEIYAHKALVMQYGVPIAYAFAGSWDDAYYALEHDLLTRTAS